jgi:hypothetical protein
MILFIGADSGLTTAITRFAAIIFPKPILTKLTSIYLYLPKTYLSKITSLLIFINDTTALLF